MGKRGVNERGARLGRRWDSGKSGDKAQRRMSEVKVLQMVQFLETGDYGHDRESRWWEVRRPKKN